MSKLISELIVDEKYHKLVPPLPESEFKQLKNSIQNNGQYLPIIVNENNVVLDGHNRYRVCKELGVTPEIKIKKFENKLLEKRFVILANLERRQLNTYQRAELAIPLLEIEKELAKERMSEGGKGKVAPNDATLGKTTQKVSKQTGLSGRTLERAKKIIEKAPEELKERVRTGQTSINYAYKTVNRQEKKKNAGPLPVGEYSVVLADPPWQYDINTRGSPDDHYDVMTVDSICSMKIPSAKNSILFLWATAPKLKEGIQVLESWGFEYKTHMVWVKNKIGTGYYFRGQHELLLVGKKGSISIPEDNDKSNSVLEAPRTKHSKKPEQVYGIIEKMYPNQKYLEVFARNTRKNWKSWGNEV